MLKWKVHECWDHEADFLDALRQCEACNFVFADEEMLRELAELKEDLHRLDESTERICALKPKYKDRYLAQQRKAEKEIELRIAQLRIPNVRVG